MRKKTYLLLTLMCVVSAVAFSSCEKIKEKIFESFTAKGADFQFTIPVIPSTTEAAIGSSNINLNVDSTIKSATNGLFDLDILKAVNAEEVTLSLQNPDQDNNLANFESLKVKVSSNNGSNSVIIASMTNPDTYSESVKLNADNSKQLIDYLKTAPVKYEIIGKARRVTTKPLSAQLVVKLKFK
ncbi:MAG: hypothetical protein ICV66_11770 [Chitinophagaceae bacterium]|nr:hypothetical protein [Chitinophagaceae bacterium]